MSNPVNPWIDVCPGIKRRTIAHGPNMYQMLAELDAGCVMPEHRHTQEQIVYVISGSIRLIVSGTPHPMAKGDSFYLASNVPHGVETIEKTTIVDTFSPTREDYLAIDANMRMMPDAVGV